MALESEITNFQRHIKEKSNEDIKIIFDDVLKEVKLQLQLYDDDDDDDFDTDNPQLLQRSVTSIENTYSQLVAAIIHNGIATHRESLLTLLIPEDKQQIFLKTEEIDEKSFCRS
jgi:hypothetical protein